MCWSHRGAILLLHVRCAAFNGKLGFGAGQLFNAQSASEPGYSCRHPIA